MLRKPFTMDSFFPTGRSILCIDRSLSMQSSEKGNQPSLGSARCAPDSGRLCRFRLFPDPGQPCNYDSKRLQIVPLNPPQAAKLQLVNFPFALRLCRIIHSQFCAVLLLPFLSLFSLHFHDGTKRPKSRLPSCLFLVFCICRTVIKCFHCSFIFVRVSWSWHLSIFLYLFPQRPVANHFSRAPQIC